MTNAAIKSSHTGFAMVPDWVIDHPLAREQGRMLHVYMAMYLDGDYKSRKGSGSWEAISGHTGLGRSAILRDVKAMSDAGIIVSQGGGVYWMPMDQPDILSTAADSDDQKMSTAADDSSTAADDLGVRPLLPFQSTPEKVTTSPNGRVSASAPKKSKTRKAADATDLERDLADTIAKAYPPNCGNFYAGRANILKLLLRGKEHPRILFAAETKAREARGNEASFTTAIQKFFSNSGDWEGYAEGYEAKTTPPTPVGPPTGDLLERARIYDQFHNCGYWTKYDDGGEYPQVTSHPFGSGIQPPKNADGFLVDVTGREYTVDHQDRRHYLDQKPT